MKSLIFPSYCLQCGSKAIDKRKLLCKECFSQIELLNLNDRCSKCFQKGKVHAHLCKGAGRVVAAFEKIGPIELLIKDFDRGGHYPLGSSLASFLFMQWQRANESDVERIFYVKQSGAKRFSLGYDSHALLANAFANLIGKKEVFAIKRGYFTDELKTEPWGNEGAALVIGISLSLETWREMEAFLRKRGFRRSSLLLLVQ